MSFIWPVMLVSLLLLPLFAWLYLRGQRRRRQIAASYGGFGLAQAAGGARLGARRHVPPALFLLGLGVLLVALARPQAVLSLPRIEGTVILAFDVSGSMAADDIKPTRMEAAKTAARAFVERQPRSVQVGVVAFSDGGLAVQPPTNDQAAIVAAINRLAPQRGTSLGQGMIVAIKAIQALSQPAERLYTNRTPTPTAVPPGTYTSATIVMLTDGENNQAPNPLEVARAAAEMGIRIYTIGVGSPAGTTLRANGFTVHTQLDAELLQQIAQRTEGAYYNAESQQELQSIYDNLDLQMVIRPEPVEITAALAAAGILALLLGAVCSMLWFGRVP